MTKRETPFHVQVIKAELERRRAKNPRYSLRAMAMALKLHPSALSRILNGTQELSIPASLIVLEEIVLSPEDKRMFLASVADEKRRRAERLLAKAIDLPLADEFVLSTADEEARPHIPLMDESLLRPESVLAYSPYLSFVLDRDGRYLYASHSGATYLGMSTGELIGKRMRDLKNLPVSMVDAMENQLVELFATGKASRIEIHQIDENGDRWIERLLSPIRGENGEVQAAISFTRSIDDQKATETKRIRDAALLDTLVAKAPVGFAFVNRELVIEMINDHAVSVMGQPREKVIGTPISRWYPDRAQAIAENINHVLRTRLPLLNLERMLPGATPAEDRYFLVSYYPVETAAGVIGVGSFFTETTEQYRYRQQRERARDILIQAGSVLGSSMEERETLRQLVQLTVPDLADVGVLDLCNEEGVLEPLEIALVHPSDRANHERMVVLKKPTLADATGPGWVAKTGRPELIERVSRDDIQMFTESPEIQSAILSLNIYSSLIVPVRADEKVIGSLTLMNAVSKRSFTPEDLDVALKLTQRAAMAIRNARLLALSRGAT